PVKRQRPANVLTVYEQPSTRGEERVELELGLNVREVPRPNKEIPRIRRMPEDASRRNKDVSRSRLAINRVGWLLLDMRSVLLQNRIRYRSAAENSPLVVLLRERHVDSVGGGSIQSKRVEVQIRKWIARIEGPIGLRAHVVEH